MANTWTVRFYNDWKFPFADKKCDTYSELTSLEQKRIEQLLRGELNVEFPIEPKIGMKIQLSSFGNIANDSSAIMCYLDRFQNVTIEKIIIYSGYILLHLDIQD